MEWQFIIVVAKYNKISNIRHTSLKTVYIFFKIKFNHYKRLFSLLTVNPFYLSAFIVFLSRKNFRHHLFKTQHKYKIVSCYLINGIGLCINGTHHIYFTSNLNRYIYKPIYKLLHALVYNKISMFNFKYESLQKQKKIS